MPLGFNPTNGEITPINDNTEQIINQITQSISSGSSSTPVISKTYAELTAMVAGSSLIPGQQYLLTDYYTKYVQPVTSTLKCGKYDYSTLSPAELAEITEGLILTAATVNTFQPTAKSTKYEGHEVVYDFNATNVETSILLYMGESDGSYQTEIGTVVKFEGVYYSLLVPISDSQTVANPAVWKQVFVSADTQRPGMIRERIDTIRKIDIAWDYKAIVFARFKPSYTYQANGSVGIIPNLNTMNERFSFDFETIAPASLNGQYFTISDLTTKYYVWFNDLDAGTPGPDPGIAGYTPIQIDYDSSVQTTIAEVIDIIVTATNGAVFETSRNGDILSVEVISAGVVLETETIGTTTSILSIANVGASAAFGYLYKDADIDGSLYYCFRAGGINLNNYAYFIKIYHPTDDQGIIGGYAYSNGFTGQSFVGSEFDQALPDLSSYQEYYTKGTSEGSIDNETDIYIGNKDDLELQNFVVKSEDAGFYNTEIINGVQEREVGSYGATISNRLFDTRAGALYNFDAYGYYRNVMFHDYVNNIYIVGDFSENFGRFSDMAITNGGNNQGISIGGLLVAGNFSGNTFFGNNGDNIIGLDFKNNQCDSIFSSNRLYGGAEGNKFGYYFDSNVFEQPFKRITTGTDFRGNTGYGDNQVSDSVFGSDVSGNIFYGFEYNIFGYSINNNTFGDGFNYNSGEHNIGDCSFGLNISYCAFSSDVVSATFPSGLYQATAVGDGAKASESNAVSLGTFASSEGESSLALGSYARSQNREGIAIGRIDLVDIKRIGAGKVQIGVEDSQDLRGQISPTDSDTLVWSDVDFEDNYAGQTTIDLSFPSTNGYTYYDNQIRTGDVLIIWDVTNDINAGYGEFRVTAHTSTSLTFDRAIPAITTGVGDLCFKYNQVALGVLSNINGQADTAVDYLSYFDKDGKLTITNGAGAGKVLTSDATGNASWQTDIKGAEFNAVDATSSPQTVNLATASSKNGVTYVVKKTDSTANTVTIVPDGAETIDGKASMILQFQNSAIDLYSNGSNWYII
jgi:hypothetical protein